MPKPGEQGGPAGGGPKVSLLDSAADALLETPEDKPIAEEEGGQGGEPEVEDTPEAETAENADDIAADDPAGGVDEDEQYEVGKPVPYDRFKKIIAHRKTLKEEVAKLKAAGGTNAEFELLKKKHAESSANYKNLETWAKKYPPLENALVALMEKKGELDPAFLNGLVDELKALAGGAPAGGAPKPAGAASQEVEALKKQMQEIADWRKSRETEEQKNEFYTKAREAFTTEFKSVKDKTSDWRKGMDKKFPGVDFGKDFMAELLENGETAAKVAEATNGESPSILALAENLAKKHFAFRQRLLGTKARQIAEKKGGALEHSDGPAGSKVKKPPAFNSPEYDQWAMDNPGYFTDSGT